MDQQSANDGGVGWFRHPHGSPTLTEEAKAWMVHLACSKPKDFGYAAEVWSRQALAQHVRKHAEDTGTSFFGAGLKSNRAANSRRSTLAAAQGDLLPAAA